MKDFSPKEWNLSKRLMATVAYFDVFDLPLKTEDLRRLIFGSRDFNSLELEVALAEIGSNVQHLDGYFFLTGRPHLVGQQNDSWRRKSKLIKKANKLTWIFRTCPFVEFVSICNYLPLGVVEENSDIDLLVVTKPGRIFTARLFLTILTHLVGARRHAEKVEGRFCLSFYLNRENLSLAPLLLEKDDIYMGFWALAILPIYGGDEVFQEFQRINDQWLRKYFDDISRRFSNYLPEKKQKNIIGRFLQYLLKDSFGVFLESKLKTYFLKRHDRNVANLPDNASVEVSSERLKFHNNDKRQYFSEQFEERLKRLQIL